MKKNQGLIEENQKLIEELDKARGELNHKFDLLQKKDLEIELFKEANEQLKKASFEAAKEITYWRNKPNPTLRDAESSLIGIDPKTAAWFWFAAALAVISFALSVMAMF